MLELGIGGGRTTPHLLAITKDYVGVDYSKRMVETCRQKFDSIFMVCDARNMPSFENERFSAVVFWGNGIDEVSPSDGILILHEVNRVLKKDGLFTFSSHKFDWHGVPAFALEGVSLSVGQLMTRLTSDVDSLNELLSSGIVTALSHAMVALYLAIWMVRINAPLASVSCSTLFAITTFAIWFRRIARPVFRNFREKIAVLNAFLQEHLTGMQVIQIFTREARELKKFNGMNQEYWKAGAATISRNALFYPAIEAVALTGIALIIWYGADK